MALPETRLLDRIGIEHPIVLAPMIGPKPSLTVSVASAGGLGSLACASMTPDQVRSAVASIREQTSAPLNLNFFCHRPLPRDEAQLAAWLHRVSAFDREYGLERSDVSSTTNRAPFDDAMCAVVEELRPKVVSFHFGLPEPALLERVRAAGCLVFASATTVAEARWLDDRDIDAVIAQGSEAGGHRGMFLTEAIGSQLGLFALLPQVVDAVRAPVIAAGGIADGRGMIAAFALGAAAVQIGTAYLRCPEAGISSAHLAALRNAQDEDTAITNVFTGRPARGLLNRAMRELGPIAADAPAFPTAAEALQPLRAAAEAQGRGDFSPLWAGQAAPLARDLDAVALTHQLVEEAQAVARRIGASYPP